MEGPPYTAFLGALSLTTWPPHCSPKVPALLFYHPRVDTAFSFYCFLTEGSGEFSRRIFPNTKGEQKENTKIHKGRIGVNSEQSLGLAK